LVQNRLQVNDRRLVECLAVAHVDSVALNGQNLHPMQTDRVRPVRGSGVEDHLQVVGGIAPRMDEEHVALGAVEPRQHDHFRARFETEKAVAKPLVNDQPSVGRAFVPLLRRVPTIDQR
jgi:hypothetical protein